MALHYLLDGYNIIKQIEELASKKLEDGREGLIRFIELYHPQGSLKNSVTIVFDGKPGMSRDPGEHFLKVIFTENESADDKIRKIVEQSSLKKSIVVVTDDRDIKYSVRSMGAAIMSVKEFCSKGKPNSFSDGIAPQRSSDKEDAKHIPKTLEFKITKELEKIWLGKEDQNKD